MQTSDHWQIYLASASPRRQELMQRLWPDKVRFILPQVDETATVKAWQAGPAELARQLAMLKAAAVLKSDRPAGRSCIVTADTLVVSQGQVLGKPQDEAEAVSHLKALSGQTHHVYTGLVLALCQEGELELLSAVEKTKVVFNQLDQAMIDWYIKTKEPMGKAGSYAIQGYGAALVKSIEGCYYNVMGLPLTRLLDLLRQAKAELTSFHNLAQLLPWS